MISCPALDANLLSHVGQKVVVLLDRQCQGKSSGFEARACPKAAGRFPTLSPPPRLGAVSDSLSHIWVAPRLWNRRRKPNLSTMQRDLCEALAEKVGGELRPSINVVMAYEDVPDGQRAMKVYNGLRSRLGRDCEFNYELWKFEALQVPELRSVATSQAREADMVVIATHSQTLSRSLKTWIAGWSAAGGSRPRALVALIEATGEWHPGTVPVFTELSEVAVTAGMEFFSRFDEPVAHSQPLTFDRLRQRAETTTSVLEQILRRSRPEPHWGINE